MSDTLLTYAVSSNPDPIQASPRQGDPSLVTLMIVVSNSTHQLINCRNISFGFVHGTNAKDFFLDSTGIESSVPKGWSITKDGDLFTAKPESAADGHIGPHGLVFVLSNIRVNEEPGTAQMTITEVTSSNTGTLSVPLAKLPPQFEVSELQINPSPPIPLGGSVTLSWNGTGDNATYALQYEDAYANTVTITHPKGEPDQPLPASGSYTIDNLQADTTFYLIVTVQVAGQDKPLVVERFFPVTVQHPRLLPAITLFAGKLKWIYSRWELTLNWDADNTDYCTISRNAYRLNPSSTDDSYRVAVMPYSPDVSSYQLTALNNLGQDTSQITLEWQLQLINSVQAGFDSIDIECSPDGKRIYLATRVGYYEYCTLRVFDAQTLQPIGQPIQVGTGQLRIAVSPDSTLVYADTPYDGLSVLDAGTFQSTGGYSQPNNPFSDDNDSVGVAASPDGASIYWVNPDGFSMTALDARSLQPTNQAQGPGFLKGISVSPDSKLIYLVGGSNSILTLDARSLQPIGPPIPVPYPAANIMLAVSADGGRLYVANSNDSTLSVLDARSLQVVGSPVKLAQQPTAIGVSSFNSYVYVTGSSGALYIFSPVNLSGGKTSA